MLDLLWYMTFLFIVQIRVCVCVCIVYLCMCAGACACGLCTEAREEVKCLGPSFSTLFFGTESVTEPGAHYFPHRAVITGTCGQAWLFIQTLRFWSRSSFLSNKGSFYPLSHHSTKALQISLRRFPVSLSRSWLFRGPSLAALKPGLSCTFNFPAGLMVVPCFRWLTETVSLQDTHE